MTIYISGIVDMPNLVERFEVQNLVSVIGTNVQPPTPPQIPPSRHHRCTVDDIVEMKPGQTVAQTEHISDLIEFLHSWDADTSLLIHCMAGVSRSTAVALIGHTLKTDDPSRSAKALRQAAPYAWPNPRIVSLADEILGLNGRLSLAREEMGPANWESDANYVVPYLNGQDARGYEPGRFAKLTL